MIWRSGSIRWLPPSRTVLACAGIFLSVSAVHMESFAAHAADVTDLEALLDFVKAYYDFDEIPYRAERIRTALGILLIDPSLGRVWIVH
jgi:hypothetical protein